MYNNIFDSEFELYVDASFGHNLGFKTYLVPNKRRNLTDSFIIMRHVVMAYDTNSYYADADRQILYGRYVVCVKFVHDYS